MQADQVPSSTWALSVAADSLTPEPYGAEACRAAAAAMAQSKTSLFHAQLGSLYLAARNERERRAVLAVDPAAFRSKAMLLGHAFSLELAKLAAPAPQADHLKHIYQHDELGRLECHISVEVAEEGGPDTPPDAGDVQVEAVYLGPLDMTYRMTDDELTAIRHDYCLARGWMVAGRIRIPAGRVAMVRAYPDCAASALSRSNESVTLHALSGAQA